jgi:hypothetical protein
MYPHLADLVEHFYGKREEANVETGIVELDDTPVPVAMLLVETTGLAKLLLGHGTQSSIQRSIASGNTAGSGIIQVVIKDFNICLLFHLLPGPGQFVRMLVSNRKEGSARRLDAIRAIVRKEYLHYTKFQSSNPHGSCVDELSLGQPPRHGHQRFVHDCCKLSGLASGWLRAPK